MLYVVSTPIGNLGDITYRAVEILKSVSLVAAEDTRCTKILFNKYDIHTPLVSYHSHSGILKVQRILETLKAGRDVALVSDAGTPGINDPGYVLINTCIVEGIPIVSIPGPSAFLAALTVSGFPMQEFKFRGFIPHKKGRETFIKSLKEEQCTVVFYESSHRIHKLMQQMLKFLPANLEICVVRELTKKFEEVSRGSLAKVAERVLAKEPKGEFVVVVRAY